jgi:hypothetical protein
MMRRVWKALATLIVLRLLFVPKLEMPLPRIVWILLLVLTLTYGFSLSFSTEIPARRRFSLGYLMFAGFSYFLAGSFGLIPDWDIIETSVWYVLISPYPLLTVLKGMIYSRPFQLDKLPYVILPIPHEYPQLNLWFSITVVVVSLVAIAAAFAMGKNKKLAYSLWFSLVVLFILEALGYVVAYLGKWGMPQFQYTGSKVPTSTIVALCWAASYAVAYFTARKGAQLQ